MWLVVLFDLPVKAPAHRKAATKFRNGLLDDGFIMLQFSVYARLCHDQQSLENHLRRCQANLPTQGAVRALQITDKQFARMQILLGNFLREERHTDQQMLFL